MFGLGKSTELKVGETAPHFSAMASDGSTISLQDFLGKAPIVIYFYPKDDTPGCIAQACGLRDDFAGFLKLQAIIFGVSYDSVMSHQAFVTKYKLPFLLLADENHAIAKAYGADSTFGAKRMTFVIDRQGKLAYINPAVKPATHSTELQEILSKLP